MCEARIVRTCFVLTFLGAALALLQHAAAFDADPKAKSPSAELQNPGSTAEQQGALPNDPGAFRSQSQTKSASPKAPVAPRITPNKDSTYILQPLRDDGFPDYFAALNQRCQGALQPEGNVAIGLLQAFGPSAIPAEIQDEYFHLLANKFQRPVGTYFVRMNEMAERWQRGTFEHGKDADQLAAYQSQFAIATQQPWSRSDFPVVAEWLAINDIPLQRIADAAKRQRFYEPVVAANRRVPALWSVALPMEQLITEISTALEDRAMLLARQNNFDAAADDLLTCHRLLRKMAACPIGQYAIESRTAEIGLFQTELKLLNFCRATKGQIARFEKGWNNLPPMPNIVDRIDVGDRFRFLDAVCVLSRQGPSALQQLLGDFSASSDDGALRTAVDDNQFDWNEPLKSGNQWFDKQGAICRISDRKQREKALQESRQELQTMKNEAGQPSMFGWLSKKSTRAKSAKVVGATLLQLFDVDLPGTLETCDQHTLHSSFAQTGLALAAYRADHNQYPKQLDELVPQYLPKLPRDIYSEHDPLHYHREPGGYTLYSVGQNGQDEQGGESERNPNSDDIAITITDAAPIATPRQ